jgi:hypothetical protein
MGVQRFRSAEAMNAAPVPANTDDGFERFLRHCSRYWAIAPRIYPRGVMKFRTLEEAQAARASVGARAQQASRGNRP